MTNTACLLSAVLIFVSKISWCLGGPLTVTSELPVSAIHNYAPSCRPGASPRVVQGCGGPLCLPKAQCATCVPHGFDAVCKAKGYRFSILVGTAHQPWSEMTPLTCNPRALMEDRPPCPRGSSCVGIAPGEGTCCYGAGPDLKHKPAEPTCPGWEECGKCPSGEVCKADGAHGNHKCVPVVKTKAGYCPINPNTTPPPYCQRLVPAVMCLDDSMCPGAFKCCSPTCGGRTCIKPVPEDYWSS